MSEPKTAREARAEVLAQWMSSCAGPPFKLSPDLARVTGMTLAQLDTAANDLVKSGKARFEARPGGVFIYPAESGGGA